MNDKFIIFAYKKINLCTQKGILPYIIILYAGIHFELAKYGFYVGLFFLFFWFLTKNQLIVISSNGGISADILASYVSKQGVKEFIHQVVKAKVERIQMLNHS